MFGKKSSKAAPRVEAYGTVDELNSVIGVARNSGVSVNTAGILDEVQSRLVGLMGELATLEEDLPQYDERGYSRPTAEDVQWIEGVSQSLESECGIRFKEWARPGKEGNAGSASLDWARAVCRRAERRVVSLEENGDLGNRNSLLFLNRLSDLLWVLARFEALAGKNA